MNLKCIVRYDGTDFAGWQVQPGQRTVQGVIEEALSQIASVPIRITGAGRTDSGVHALGQVFSCDWTGPKDPTELRRSLSQMLGPEIRIESAEEAPEGFHALHSASTKRYAYVICQAKESDPFMDRYAWTIPWEIDWDCVARLVKQIEGDHDFAGFCSSGSEVDTTTRTIYSAELKQGPLVGPIDAQAVHRIELHGNGFLYKMVRNIVGATIDIARGQAPESRLEELLQAPMPYLGFTAPGKGLFLQQVDYRTER